jgi:non-reducing end alpha-L-arabinofuranosidase
MAGSVSSGNFGFDGSAGSGGSGANGTADSGVAVGAGPCDIYASAGTPCVAAHSTVRALADSAAQDAFCSGTTWTISMIYDQSPRGNNLTSAPAGEHKNTPDDEASATALKLTVGGHAVYAVVVNPGIGYRDDATSGIATGDEPEGEYMVTSGTHYNDGCCFDYGNAGTDNRADGDGTMEGGVFWK